MTRPRLVLFDIGSTLWSSPPEDEGALAFCYGRARDVLVRELAEGTPPIEALVDAVEGYFAEWEDIWREDATKIEQEPTHAFVKEALSRLDITPTPEALAEFTDLLLETSIYTARAEMPEPGMAEALAALKSRGLRLACVSNAFMPAAALQRIMVEKGLGEYLDFTVSSCELGIRKPDPRIYQEALRVAGVAGEETIFVGDRLDADVAGPASQGMRTVLTHQYRREEPAGANVQPDCVVSHLSELVDYVDAVLAEEGAEKAAGA